MSCLMPTLVRPADVGRVRPHACKFKACPAPPPPSSLQHEGRVAMQDCPPKRSHHLTFRGNERQRKLLAHAEVLWHVVPCRHGPGSLWLAVMADHALDSLCNVVSKQCVAQGHCGRQHMACASFGISRPLPRGLKPHREAARNTGPSSGRFICRRITCRIVGAPVACCVSFRRPSPEALPAQRWYAAV